MMPRRESSRNGIINSLVIILVFSTTTIMSEQNNDDCHYVVGNTTIYSDKALNSCYSAPLASPLLEYNTRTCSLQIDGTNINTNNAQHIWVGYIEMLVNFTFKGGIHKDYIKGLYGASYTCRLGKRWDVGQCYSICKTPKVGLLQNHTCYCFAELSDHSTDVNFHDQQNFLQVYEREWKLRDIKAYLTLYKFAALDSPGSPLTGFTTQYKSVFKVSEQRNMTDLNYTPGYVSVPKDGSYRLYFNNTNGSFHSLCCTTSLSENTKKTTENVNEHKTTTVFKHDQHMTDIERLRTTSHAKMTTLSTRIKFKDSEITKETTENVNKHKTTTDAQHVTDIEIISTTLHAKMTPKSTLIKIKDSGNSKGTTENVNVYKTTTDDPRTTDIENIRTTLHAKMTTLSTPMKIKGVETLVSNRLYQDRTRSTIAFSVGGGVIFIIITICLIVWYCRRKRKDSHVDNNSHALMKLSQNGVEKCLNEESATSSERPKIDDSDSKPFDYTYATVVRKNPLIDDIYDDTGSTKPKVVDRDSTYNRLGEIQPVTMYDRVDDIHKAIATNKSGMNIYNYAVKVDAERKGDYDNAMVTQRKVDQNYNGYMTTVSPDDDGLYDRTTVEKRHGYKCDDNNYSHVRENVSDGEYNTLSVL